MRVAAVLGFLALTAAACGSGRGADYALTPTLSCLKASGLKVIEEDASANPLARGKPDLDVDYGDEDVYVIFAKDSQVARDVESAVNRLGAGIGGSSDVAARTANVVMYSNGEKISAEREHQIESCLRRARPGMKAHTPTKILLNGSVRAELRGAVCSWLFPSGGRSQKTCLSQPWHLRLSKLDTQYALAVGSGVPQGQYEAYLLRRREGRWRVLVAGSDQIVCGKSPPAVERELLRGTC